MRAKLASAGLVFCVLICGVEIVSAGEPSAAAPPSTAEYRIGVDDVLDINVLQPEPLASAVTVSPDGTIVYPYIGSIKVQGLTLAEAQELVQRELSGYLKYPIIAISLRESRSRKFFVYGEVVRPGGYPYENDLTVVKAISIAGGFTKYGSSSKVKVLRHRANGTSDTIKVDVKRAMDGAPGADLRMEPGDIVSVSEGVF